MKLIVGLGNPGKLYADTRHNIGFSVVKALAKACGILLKKERGSLSLSGKANIESQSVILAIPFTFMNLSGIAVSALLKKYKIDLDNLLLVHDDLDLELGRFKIKASGSSCGHHGLKSIIDSVGSQEFCRLRIGIGRPIKNMDPAEYVLSPFGRKEKRQLKGVIEKAVDCCKVWVTKGTIASMNNFNRWSK